MTNPHLLDVIADCLGWIALAYALAAILHLITLAARILSRARTGRTGW